MSIMQARRAAIALLVSTGALASAGLAAWTAASAHGRIAHAAASCGVGSGTGYGYTYLTSLSVTHTSCGTGRFVARKHGHVSGWHCSTKRLATSSVQYESRVICSSGGRRVVWTFSQNT
jgi:hypothetical protein